MPKELVLIAERNKGIVLLLVLLILASLLSISIGIFNLTIGELRVSGEVVDSFAAFYAADEAIEKTLYLDRVVRNTVCIDGKGKQVFGPDCYVDSQILSNGSGFTVKVTKTSSRTDVLSVGQFQCPGLVGSGVCGENSFRVVKRGFLVSY